MALANPTPLETTMLAREELPDDLEAGRTNYDVGTSLLFENDRVRVWELELEPGQRLPFHFHRTTYYWVCIEGGECFQRMPDGTRYTWQMNAGDVDWLGPDRLEEEALHDLENTGDTTLRFTTVEILD
jgi:quercetin dioxygenase-like cupin family protein